MQNVSKKRMGGRLDRDEIDERRSDEEVSDAMVTMSTFLPPPTNVIGRPVFRAKRQSSTVSDSHRSGMAPEPPPFVVRNTPPVPPFRPPAVVPVIPSPSPPAPPSSSSEDANQQVAGLLSHIAPAAAVQKAKIGQRPKIPATPVLPETPKTGEKRTTDQLIENTQKRRAQALRDFQQSQQGGFAMPYYMEQGEGSGGAGGDAEHDDDSDEDAFDVLDREQRNEQQKQESNQSTPLPASALPPHHPQPSPPHQLPVLADWQDIAPEGTPLHNAMLNARTFLHQAFLQARHEPNACGGANGDGVNLLTNLARAFSRNINATEQSLDLPVLSVWNSLLLENRSISDIIQGVEKQIHQVQQLIRTLKAKYCRTAFSVHLAYGLWESEVMLRLLSKQHQFALMMAKDPELVWWVNALLSIPEVKQVIMQLGALHVLKVRRYEAFIQALLNRPDGDRVTAEVAQAFKTQLQQSVAPIEAELTTAIRKLRRLIGANMSNSIDIPSVLGDTRNVFHL